MSAAARAIVFPVSTDIIRGVPDRSADAQFRVLYERHADEILRYAIRCTGRREIAEEIASEAFLRLYERRGEIDPERAGAWLTTAVKNLATDYWRHRAVERKHEDALRPDPASPRGRECEELLRNPALKAEHRACLTLHYVHGLSNKEITSATGLTENQVKNALQYGLKLLRKALGGERT